MAVAVTHAEQIGGAPGSVVVRVHGHSSEAIPAPALLVRDGAQLLRIEPANPHALEPNAAFALDYAVPLHAILQPGDWWLEPPAHQRPDVAALRAQVAELGRELEQLRATLAQPEPPAPSRRRRRGALLPAALVATGTLAVADAVATVVWQEPVSAIYALRTQQALKDDLHQVERRLARAVPVLPQLPSPESRMRALARELQQSTNAGEALGRLQIPRLDQRQVVVQGTGSGALRKGPGHYATTPLPGEGGTVGIAGHRTTYGAPFRDLDQLRRGDAIDLEMPYGRFTYRVEGTRIVEPDDVSVLRRVSGERLALTACHPLYSAAERIVVLARLERAAPTDAAGGR